MGLVLSVSEFVSVLSESVLVSVFVSVVDDVEFVLVKL